MLRENETDNVLRTTASTSKLTTDINSLSWMNAAAAAMSTAETNTYLNITADNWPNSREPT